MVAHRAAKSKRGEIGWWSDPLPMQAARSRVRRTARIILGLFWNLGRPPAPAGDDEATHGETLPAAPGLAEHIAKILFALDEFEDRRAADRDSAGLRSATRVFWKEEYPVSRRECPSQARARDFVKMAGARGGGGSSPEGALRRQPPPKLRLAPSPRCRVSGRLILCRAARCHNML
jgi:hypothetical protein